MQSKLTLAVHIISLIIELARRSFTCLKNMKNIMLCVIAMARFGLWMCSISLLIRFFDKSINFWMDALMLAYGIMNLIPLFCIIPFVFIVDHIYQRVEKRKDSIDQRCDHDAYCAICMD